MKRLLVTKIIIFVSSIFLLWMPGVIHAQSSEQKAEPPPIAQPLVRQGDFALKLVSALGLSTTDNEAEAESQLGAVGIAPRNGWIADYPVTPDIAGELQKSVSDAADAGKISMNRNEALKRLNDVHTEFGLSVTPHTVTKTYEALPEDVEEYPNQAAIDNYYYNEGPPVVTYYAPPPYYYYLYSWVPYPFWWSGFWFSGFFVLNDFHRTVFVHHRPAFVSNHFNDFRVHRVFRIDPVARFHGRTFAGIGVHHRRGFVSTGVPGSARTIFNGPHVRTWSGSRPTSPSFQGGRTFQPSSRGGVSGRMVGTTPRGGTAGSPSFHGGRTFQPSSQSGVSGRTVGTMPRDRTTNSPSFRGGTTDRQFFPGGTTGRPSFRPGTMSSPPSRGGTMSSPPSRGGVGWFGGPSGGGSGSMGGWHR